VEVESAIPEFERSKAVDLLLSEDTAAMMSDAGDAF
jgi:hypothetical protein